ncbi:hypothetical protein BA195_10155 [Tenacibaculum soleae]|uniref:Uncharacterized protein n=1 Tax=Tenacibaculum soleae TaxID=447689 RepID=A0A1B9XYC2_9FLAO|nr:hypothetical protein [Tenacibaculum soleae]OCK42529.1 hypothetical protein BA195_10155 [Tenacibaculum soleae]
MNNIITAKEFAEYRNISKKIDEGKINECIKLAQSVDLFDVLNDFYFDLLQGVNEPEYNELMSGGTFTSEGKNYYQEGLKSLLADYTYSRYIYVINTNHTSFGYQQKYTEDSQPVDRNFIKDVVKQTQIDASIKFKMIDKYLQTNKAIFPRYSNNNNPDINTFGQRFTIIK